MGVLFMVVYKYKVRSMRKKNARREDKESIRVSWKESKFLPISYVDIQKATDDFSTKNLIGSGGFGTVYKGTVTTDVPEHSTIDIAVKVLNEKHRAISKSFVAECKVLRNVRHRNLVRVLTACSSEDVKRNEFKALVYEYMPNHSLDKWLKKSKEEEPGDDCLSLLQRLNIAIDVASALDYLHTQTEVPIVHCDLKPSNILLDVNMTAHVSDFGIAKFLTMDLKNKTLSTTIQGSIGYIAPECGVGSQLSTLWDVHFKYSC